MLTEGMHSGDASGLVPSSFRILRQVLDRLEDSGPARCCPRASIARSRPTALRAGARPPRAILRRRGLEAHAVGLRRRRRPGAAHHHRPDARRCSIAPGGRRCRSPASTAFPSSQTPATCCGPYTAFKLSLRLPPLVDGNEASPKLKALLEDNAPYNAKVTFQPGRPRGRLRRHRLERARARAVAGRPRSTPPSSAALRRAASATSARAARSR